MTTTYSTNDDGDVRLTAQELKDLDTKDDAPVSWAVDTVQRYGPKIKAAHMWSERYSAEEVYLVATAIDWAIEQKKLSSDFATYSEHDFEVLRAEARRWLGL
jgi:hypothetical protein